MYFVYQCLHIFIAWTTNSLRLSSSSSELAYIMELCVSICYTVSLSCSASSKSSLVLTSSCNVLECMSNIVIQLYCTDHLVVNEPDADLACGTHPQKMKAISGKSPGLCGVRECKPDITRYAIMSIVLNCIVPLREQY